MVGVKNFFRTDELNDNFVGTYFICIIFPFIPTKSFYSIHNDGKNKQHEIPSNRKSIIKNFCAFYFLVIGAILLVFNLLFNRNILFGDIFSLPSNIFEGIGLSLEGGEKLLATLIFCLGIYFFAFYGNLTKAEKEDIQIIKKSPFSYTILPGRNLIPALGKYYVSDDQRVLINQMYTLLFKLYYRGSDEEQKFRSSLNIYERVEEDQRNFKDLIQSGEFKSGSSEALAFLLLITCNLKYHDNNIQNNNLYNTVKNYLKTN